MQTIDGNNNDLKICIYSNHVLSYATAIMIILRARGFWLDLHTNNLIVTSVSNDHSQNLHVVNGGDCNGGNNNNIQIIHRIMIIIHHLGGRVYIEP